PARRTARAERSGLKDEMLEPHRNSGETDANSPRGQGNGPRNPAVKHLPHHLSRRDILRLAGRAAALALLGRPGHAGTRTARRPNLVMIVADDHRHSAIGALGEPTVISPVLDRLTTDGTAFTCA